MLGNETRPGLAHGCKRIAVCEKRCEGGGYRLPLSRDNPARSIFLDMLARSGLVTEKYG